MSKNVRDSLLIYVRFIIDIFPDGRRPGCHGMYGSKTLLRRSVNSIYHLDDDHQSYGMYDVVYYRWFFIDASGGRQ